MKRISEVVAEKALQQVITIDPAASVTDAAELMTRWNVGALLVLEDSRLVGIVSERDYVRSFGAMGRSLEGITVRDIMARHVRMVPGDVTTEECMWLMTYLRVRHLPVMDGAEVLGLISIGDLIKDVVTEQALGIDQFEPMLSRGPNA